LNRHTVLTAAHCLVGQLKVEMYFGVHDKTSDLDIVRTADRVVIHENYTVIEQGSDIGLLQFIDPVVTSESIYPACLPNISLADAQNPPQGADVFAAGWGTTTEGGSTSDVLLNIAFKVIDNTTCNTVYSNSPGSFCAGVLTGGKDTCQGKIETKI
jgi:trypsin